MKLKEIILENFRGKKNLQLSLGKRLTLLLGENGSGKSTILDGIAIGLGAVLTHLPEVSGITFGKTDLRQHNNKLAPYVRVKIHLTNGTSWDRTQKRDKSKTTAQQVPPGIGLKQLYKYLDQNIIDPHAEKIAFELPVFAHYGVSRALLDVPLRRRGFPKSHQRFEALDNALNAVSRFKSAFVWFYNKEVEEQRGKIQNKNFEFRLPELDAVRNAIVRIFPDITEPHIILNPLRFAVKMNGESLDISLLSDGYKTLLSLVIDLASHMALANPQKSDPLDSPAVVLVDEVDLHLHPEWQRRVIGDLLAVFTNTQFILTTHSPYIVEAINNHLQRNHIEGLFNGDKEIEHILPLSPEDVTAWSITVNDKVSLMDPDIQLLDDKLIHSFNKLTGIYERMRDMQWENQQHD